MVDDGYLVGYEDSNGNFVEVGRFNNTSENVSDPLVIQHTDSGETMELGPNGFSTNSVSTDVLNSNAGLSGTTGTLLSAVQSSDGLGLKAQETLTVSTSAKTILTLEHRAASVIVVGEKDGTETTNFIDEVYLTTTSNPQTDTKVDANAPATRTYDRNGFNLDLTMGSDTYNVTAIMFNLDPPA